MSSCEKIYKVLGLMSGTSLDGLDLAYCFIWIAHGKWNFKIEKAKTIAYSEAWKNKLKNAIHVSETEHQKLHEAYGIWLGEQSKQFIEQENLEVDFIASHGHTSHHRPDEGFTFQLGSGQHVATTSGQKVICDFRTKDVALGGQGAPIVPIGDQLFFSEYNYCLNLGGISNISFEKDEKRIAYDIGLANMPLNYITQKINLEYDNGGQLARKGIIDKDLLLKLNALAYYQLPYPKSTGYEWFVSKVIPLIDAAQCSIEDLLHTIIHHNCEQIASEIKGATGSLFATGGGALNEFFIEVLQEKSGNVIEVTIPSKTLIEYKEALVFALMGVLKEEDEINVLSSVTGAKEDSSCGVVFMPLNNA